MTFEFKCTFGQFGFDFHDIWLVESGKHDQLYFWCKIQNCSSDISIWYHYLLILHILDYYGVFLKAGIILNSDVTPSYALVIECGDHRRNVTDVLTVDIINPNMVRYMEYELYI